MKSVGLNCKAFLHVLMCVIAIRIRSDETNGPEDEGKDQRTDGQHQGGDQARVVVAILDLFYYLLVRLSRLDVNNIHSLVQRDRR